MEYVSLTISTRTIKLQHHCRGVSLRGAPAEKFGTPTRGISVGGLVAKLCPTLVTPRTVDRQAPLSMGFPRQEYWME